MADVSQRDRSPYLTELTKTPWPAPPLNVYFTHGYREGVIDLYWDDPATLALNSRFQILGVNVYRSFDSEFGPYRRITELPLGATYWRDETDNELVTDEDVTDRFLRFGNPSSGQHEGPRFVFQTQFPIVKSGSQAVPALTPSDVRVYINDVEAKVLRVNGQTGEVELDILTRPDPATQKVLAVVVPKAGDRVTCTYFRNRSLLKTSLFQRVFYRVTTVGLPVGVDLSQVHSSCDLLETPIEHATATHTFEIEKLDAYWKEAIRRNRWILEQGGERVKAFIQKSAGIPCPCIPDDHHKQPTRDCLICYGVGIIGGYEGPYDIIIAPDDGERRVAQTELGRRKEHSYEVWTGPTPLLSHRDFIVKQNNDRYSIGGVRMPSNRGNILQQHFTIGIFDGQDIRAKVPVTDPVRYVAVQLSPQGPELSASTDRTDHPGIGDERELRGRTPVWQNQNYGILLWLLPAWELARETFGSLLRWV